MAFHHSITTNSALNKQFLAPPSGLSRKASQQAIPPARDAIDDFLSSDLDLELELSFASTMSLNSPPRDLATLAPEDPSYAPMDISPAPQRLHPYGGNALKPSGRPRALTGETRTFGKDLSNSTESLPIAASRSKTGSGTTSGKRLQRAALPLEWMAPVASSYEEKNSTQPMEIPSSPGEYDAMDVDLSFSHVASSSAPEEHGPLSAAPTITAFQLYGQAASDVQTNPFFDDMEQGHDDSDLSGIIESPSQPFPKKRRSSSPKPQALRSAYQHILDEESFSSPVPPSSPSERKVERIVSAVHRKSLLGLGAPAELNANKKRPRRPALSSMISSTESPVPQSAYPVLASGPQNKENSGPSSRHVLPPVRRAFSAMLPPSALDEAFALEEGSSFEADGIEMSSPAQACAHRQQMKTIRRCDGTEDFRPLTGASALTRHDTEAVLKGLRKSEEREDRTHRQETAKGDTPRSRYLNAGPGLGSFGDNEASGKILPCHRVREDGLMRITAETLDALLDGAFDSQIIDFHIVDCRFDYEYNGGHIPGATNINTNSGIEEFLLGPGAPKPQPSISGDHSKKTIVVFHCEFSVKRAPTFAKHLRSKDRALNNHVYPRIHYPEVYVLEGGYSQYFQRSGARCQPPAYVQMDDPNYAASRKEDLDQFRKGKFGRTKSYAYGEGKMATLAAPPQAKRSSAPSGAPALFAAANAARSRRGGVASDLHTLQEDGINHSEDEETDIGDSPCPPPTKAVAFKGKKIGRIPLVKSESYGPMRMGY